MDTENRQEQREEVERLPHDDTDLEAGDKDKDATRNGSRRSIDVHSTEGVR